MYCWVKNSGEISRKRHWLSKKLLHQQMRLSIRLWWSYTNLLSSTGSHYLVWTFFMACVLLSRTATDYAGCVSLSPHGSDCTGPHASIWLRQHLRWFQSQTTEGGWGGRMGQKCRWSKGSCTYEWNRLTHTDTKKSEHQYNCVMFYEHSSTVSTWLC